MRKVLRKTASLSLAVLLGVLSFGAHAGAVSRASSHVMDGMNHNTSLSSCATICTSATLYREELTDESGEEEDDKTGEPFYMHLRPPSIALLEKEHDTQARAVLKHEPPPGLPAYLTLTVFRA